MRRGAQGPGRAGIVVLIGLLLAAPAAAQERCGDSVREVGLTAAAVRSDLAGGQLRRGVEAGVAGRGPLGASTLSGDAWVVLADDSPARQLGLRARLAHPLVDPLGILLCGSGLAGVASVTAGSDATLSLAGGGALTALRSWPAGAAVITPFIGVRALAALTAGEVLGESVQTTGLSLGAEGGIAVGFGAASLAFEATVDGFDPGLGPTPYHDVAVRLTAGWRF